MNGGRGFGSRRPLWLASRICVAYRARGQIRTRRVARPLQPSDAPKEREVLPFIISDFETGKLAGDLGTVDVTMGSPQPSRAEDGR